MTKTKRAAGIPAALCRCVGCFRSETKRGANLGDHLRHQSRIGRGRINGGLELVFHGLFQPGLIDHLPRLIGIEGVGIQRGLRQVADGFALRLQGGSLGLGLGLRGSGSFCSLFSSGGSGSFGGGSFGCRGFCGLASRLFGHGGLLSGLVAELVIAARSQKDDDGADDYGSVHVKYSFDRSLWPGCGSYGSLDPELKGQPPPENREIGCKLRKIRLLDWVAGLQGEALGSRLRAHNATARRTTTIARRPHNAPPQRETGPRINDRIRAPEIRLIGADGENVGVVTPARALQMAEEAGLDLVEISPNAVPPVCKIMDFGKFKYETQKREAEARKKQKIIEIKEIKFRPGTDKHDYDVKMRSVLKFLEEGDKVKVTLRFRGREMAHQELGLELLNRVAADVGDAGKIESMPKLEGRQMVMMVAPK